MNILLAVILLVNLLLFVSFVLIFLRIRTGFRSFIAPRGENPSQFAELCQDIGKTLGHSAAMEIKTTIMGKISGQVRSEEAVSKAVLNETQPQLSGLLDAIPPSFKGSLRKNPGLASLALNFLMNKVVSQPGYVGSAPSNGQAERPKFKL